MKILQFKTVSEYEAEKSSIKKDYLVYIEETDKILSNSDNSNVEFASISITSCSTEGNVVEKVVESESFKPKKNSVLSVLFENGFTVSNPTINVNEIGATPILYMGEPIEMEKVTDNTILTMIYDEESFNVAFIQKGMPQVDYVDLGLPSGRLWATKNIGAENPEDAGLYFSWGNTEGHTATEVDNGDYNFSGEFDWGNQEWKGGDYAKTEGSKVYGNIANSESFDAARKHLGTPWRMPSKEDFQELNDNCTSTWTTRNGVNGRLFTGQNGNSIFFPAAGYCDNGSVDYRGSLGYYWSSSFCSGYYAFSLRFRSGNVSPQNYSDRYCGSPVRAVQ